ncbi:UNVERIFIED_CONTAM: hypothetical protein K2H54_055766 [Gekko kuhli]
MRGQKRSAVECQTKSEALCQDYKKVVAHNNRSGNSPMNCPYDHKLHCIFHGDTSIAPMQVETCQESHSKKNCLALIHCQLTPRLEKF